MVVEKRGNRWCVIHCTGLDKGKAIKCFSTKKEADDMHKAIQVNKSINEFSYVFDFQKIGSADDSLYLAGHASSEKVDVHNEIMDAGSLKHVWDDFMLNPVVKFAHAMRGLKGDIGKVIPEHIDSEGKVWNTKFDHSDRPFVVVKINDDPKLEGLRAEIRAGKYRGLSLNGLAYKAMEYSKEAGRVVERLFVKKINELSVVDVPANTDAFATVLKMACVDGKCGIEAGNEGQQDPIPADIVVKGDQIMGEFTKEDMAGLIRSTLSDMSKEEKLISKAAAHDDLLKENTTLKTEIETLRGEFEEFKKSAGKNDADNADADAMKTEITGLREKLDKLASAPFFKAQLGEDSEKTDPPVADVRGAHIGAMIRANYGA